MKKKLLFFLSAEKKSSRIIRRGVAIFILAGLASVIGDTLFHYGHYLSETWIILLTAILATLDKTLRELKK